MKKLIMGLASLSLLAGLAGCGGGGGTAVAKDQTKTPVATTQDGTTSADTTISLASAKVSLPAGTKLTDIDGNAVTGPITATILVSSKTNDLAPEAKVMPAGADIATFLDIKLETEAGVNVKYLSQPMTVNVKVQGTKPGDTVIHYSFNGVSWIAEDTAIVKDDGTADILVNHFSYHGVFKSKEKDITPPTVKQVTPADNATGVSLNEKITVVFSEPMAPSTIKESTVTVKAGNVEVDGEVSYNKDTLTAVFTPKNNLAASASYTVTVTTGVKDLAGNALIAAKVWTFTTGLEADTTAPTVKSVIPANDSTGVAVDAKLRIIFSEPMDPATVKDNLINDLPGTVTYDPATNTATFTPKSAFVNSKKYTFTVRSKAKDLAGNTNTSYTWSFTTTPAGTTGTTGGTGGSGTGSGF